MEDCELFYSYILGIEAPEDEEVFPLEFMEYKEGNADINESPAHCFEEKAIRYEESLVETTNLGNAENPRNILVWDNCNPVLKAATFKIFMEFKDVSPWTYKDLKGVLLEMCVHRIPLVPGAIPLWKPPYRMNKNYAARINEEIQWMLEADIIFKVQTSEWVSPIVISTKDGIQIWICVDFLCLIVVTIKYPFPIPFTNMIMEEVARHEMYSFMDEFFGYN